MAITTAESTILNAGTSVLAGGTEAAPNAGGVGATVGPFADYGNTFAYRITNGSSAPTLPVTIVFYAVSGSRLYEIDRVSGDAISSSTYSGAIPCPVGFASFTAKAFGNTTNPVAVEVFLERLVP